MKPIFGSFQMAKAGPLLLSAAFFLLSPLSLSSLPACAQEVLPDSPAANLPAPPAGPGEEAGPGLMGFAGVEEPFEPVNFAMAGPGGGCPVLGGLKGDNALTDEQWEKMYALKNEFLDKLGPKMVEAMSLERHLKDVLSAGEIDTKKAGELKGKLAAVKYDLANLKVDNQIKLMSILTPEQRKAIRLSSAKGGGFGPWAKGGKCHSMGRRGSH